MGHINHRQIRATLDRCEAIDRAHLKLTVADLTLRKKYPEAREAIHNARWIITQAEALEMLSAIANAVLADKIVSVG